MSVERFTGQQRWVLGLIAAASFIAVMDGMVVTTALDAIRRDLSPPLSDLHWTMTAYSLSFAALLMAGAALGDRIGRRTMFILGLSAFAAASAGCAPRLQLDGSLQPGRCRARLPRCLCRWR